MTLPLVGLTPLMQVFDMPASLAFYCGKLGFQIVSASPEVTTAEGCFSHWVWLRSGNIDVMLNTAYDSGERPSSPDAARHASHADTCLYIGCRDLDLVHSALCQAELAPEPPVMAPYGLRRFSLRDPDNFEIVFQETR